MLKKEDGGTMTFVTEDFAYYKRSIQLMYQRYYQKRLLAVGISSGIIFLYLLLMKEAIFLNILLLTVLIGAFIYLSYRLQQFPTIYENFIKENNPPRIFQVTEEEYSFVVENGKTGYRLNKKGLRNFPSKNQQYTLMAGFAKNFFTKEPLILIYYDLLELKYEEKFRLKKGGYQAVPRFLRGFTPSNLKATFGNFFNFVFSNLLILYIFYRLVRYLWAFLQYFLR